MTNPPDLDVREPVLTPAFFARTETWAPAETG